MASPRTACPLRSAGRSPTVLYGTAALAAVSAVLLTLVALRWGPLMRLDRAIADTAHRWALASPGVTEAFRVLTDWVWDPWTLRLLCAVAALWLVRRRGDWWTAGWLAVTCLVAGVLQQGLKAAVGRPRPVWTDPVDTASYAAYPSGHALTAAMSCALLVWLLRRERPGAGVLRGALVLAALSVTGVGVTRIWLGVHWASDVVGGWLLGALIAGAAVLVHPRPVPPAAGRA